MTSLVAQLPETALDRFGHAPEVVGSEELLRGDPEEPVVGLFGSPVLEDDERRDRIGPLQVRDVEGLDPAGRDREIEHASQPLDAERFFPAHPPESNLVPLAGVVGGELDPFVRRTPSRNAASSS